MGKFLQYRDGGKTDEKGISTHLSGLFKGEVINGLAVAQGSPLGMTVNVSKGRCMIDSGDDYPYLGFTDDIETVTITTADGSNPRIDAIVGYVDLSVVDSTNANNPDAFVIVAVPGTPAGSPNAPNDGAVESAIGLGNPFIRLAHVTVGTGVTTITNGNISDQRVIVSSPDDFIGTSQIKDKSVTIPKLGGSIIVDRGFDNKVTNNTVVSTSYTTYATVTATTTGGKVRISYSADFRDSNSGATRTGNVAIFIDGTIAPASQILYWTASGLKDNVSLEYEHTPPAGSHTYTLRAQADTASATYLGKASLSVVEILPA